MLEVESVSTFFKSERAILDIRTGENLSIERFRGGQRKASSVSYAITKRLMDLVICFALLLLIWPLFLVLAIAVRFSSPGPVFYREERIGRSGKPFIVYKFRSMHTLEYLTSVLGYDECAQTQLRRRQHDKDTADPRVTSAGRYLRKTSLDELPQLINVLRGDMSLIGPRPVVLDELAGYGDDVFFYMLMYPGITGLWQVSGRSNVSFNQRVQLDAHYCSEWTPWMDINILLRTIPAVLQGKGAY